MTDAEAEIILDRHAAALSEHFGAVQIMVTWPGGDGSTHCARRGSGDWYARQGMAHEFIAADKARDQAREIANALNREG